MTMTATTSDDVQIEFVSSALVRAEKKRRVFRRRLLLVLFTVPKILVVAYFGFDELITWRETTAAVLQIGAEAVAAFNR